jgi:hypothetical protein
LNRPRNWHPLRGGYPHEIEFLRNEAVCLVHEIADSALGLRSNRREVASSMGEFIESCSYLGLIHK